MDNRRAQLIAEVVKHLEDLDASDLKGQMAPEEAPMPGMEGMDGIEGGSEGMEMEAKDDSLGEDPGGMGPEGDETEDMDDEDLEELGKMA